MRGFLALALLLAAGCQSEVETRSQIRDGGIRSCVEGFRRSSGGQELGARVDVERVCACTIDRIMADRSVDQLRDIGNAPPTPQERAQAQQCMLDALGNTSAPAPAG